MNKIDPLEFELLKEAIKNLTIRFSVVEKVLKKNTNYAELLEKEFKIIKKDPLINDAKKIIQEYDKINASVLMKELSVGYARALRILDQLAVRRIVSKRDGAAPRKVFKTK